MRNEIKVFQTVAPFYTFLRYLFSVLFPLARRYLYSYLYRLVIRLTSVWISQQHEYVQNQRIMTVLVLHAGTVANSVLPNHLTDVCLNDDSFVHINRAEFDVSLFHLPFIGRFMRLLLVIGLIIPANFVQIYQLQTDSSFI
jgi:hypothetical protein